MHSECKFVTVVLPAYNEEKYIISCLSGLLAQDYPKSLYEIILVDNGSTDATVNIAQDFGVKVINEPEGPVGKVRNTGARNAQGDLLLFLDSDCIPPRNWISYASKRIASNSNLILGGGCELPPDPKAIEKYWLLSGIEGATLPKDLLGACIAISKSVFFQVGGFDETVTSGEDSKLSETLRKNGFDVVIDRQLSVIHLGNATKINHFLRRQIWHSENYIQDFSTSISDPTFLLIFVFTTLAATSLAMIPFSFILSFVFAFLAVSVPLLFSIKRIIRSRNFSHLKNLHKIYCLDSLYVLARSLGLLRGIYIKLKSKL